MASSAEDRREEPPKATSYKTKAIQFLGRTTPIILQNDNGPCPLLAICNVLSLKNSLNLSADGADILQERLLSLVAERLIDSNSNVNNKDEGYIENQQQNIADAIDLLPRLTTGIDVNIKFRRIDDFEFTRECAIFDLLDIPLYHGWIVDPQDHDTANAIGSKSYNTLTSELVALETRNVVSEHDKKKSSSDYIDFAAATTATLGVPSPCLSSGKSFDDSNGQNMRKGDFEEEAELLRALRLSESEMLNPNGQNVSVDSNESVHLNKSEPLVLAGTLEGKIDEEIQRFHQQEHSVSDDQGNPSGQLNSEESGEKLCKDIAGKTIVDPLVKSETALFDSCVQDSSFACETHIHSSGGESTLRGEKNEAEAITLMDSSSERRNNVDVHETVTSSAEGSDEPIYEEQECVVESTTKTSEDREPMYEGEVVLTEQVGKDSKDPFDISSREEITPKQGEVIRNFLKNSASQLTLYGLFCLQKGLKDRELCVFFRNNHFNTMFKYEGERYLLATDQGYINQPDLVWEKLNEVNGDTVFMTGDFKEFKMEENHASTTWGEGDAMNKTVEHLPSIDGPDSSYNSDLQLAMALQQEYDRELQAQRNSQQQNLVVGPQVPRNSMKNSSSSSSSSSSKPEAKPSKDKCVLM